MRMIHKNEIILANIIAAVLNIEINEKIISKAPVLTQELYSHICYTNLFSSNAFLTNQSYTSLLNESLKEVVDKSKSIYKTYGIIDLTEYDVVQQYLDEFLEKYFEDFTTKVTKNDEEYFIYVYGIKDEVIESLSFAQKLLVSHLISN